MKGIKKSPRICNTEKALKRGHIDTFCILLSRNVSSDIEWKGKDSSCHQCLPTTRTEEYDEALAATKHMTAQGLPSFNEHPWTVQQMKEEAFSYLKVDLVLKFVEFVENDYFKIMVETLKANKVTIHNNTEDKERGESKHRFRRTLKNQTFSL